MPFLGPAPEKAPRAIIFDIGRVIIRVDLSRSMGALGQRNGLTHAQVMRELETDARWNDWEEGRMAPREWHAHLAQKLGFSYDFEQFCAVWNSVLAPDPILPDQIFERLSAKCRLALLSNTDPLHVAHFEATHTFARHFPVRVYSCRVGTCKPSPMIFHHTLGELGALPEETLFIDDLRDNVLAAAALGIHGFHFTDREDLLAELARLKL